jgi:hypothetical protein
LETFGQGVVAVDNLDGPLILEWAVSEWSQVISYLVRMLIVKICVWMTCNSKFFCLRHLLSYTDGISDGKCFAFANL